MTAEDVARGLKALKEAAAHRAEQRARRGGQPMAESWEDIRQARAERSRHLLEL